MVKFSKSKSRRSNDCPFCMDEETLQKSVAQYLRAYMPTEIFWTSIESSGRGMRDGVRQKAKGVNPGTGDMLFLLTSHVWIELKRAVCRACKRKAGTHGKGQKVFQAAAVAAGGHYYIARSLDEVIDILRSHGVDLKAKPV